MSSQNIVLNNENNEKESLETGEAIFKETNEYIRRLKSEPMRRHSFPEEYHHCSHREAFKKISRLESSVPTEEFLPEFTYAEEANIPERDVLKEMGSHGEKLIEEIKSSEIKEIEFNVLRTYMKCILLFMTTSILFLICFVCRCIYLALFSIRYIRQTVDSIKEFLKRIPFRRGFDFVNICSEDNSLLRSNNINNRAQLIAYK